MLYRLYYWLSGVFFRHQVKSLGKHTQLRLQGRIISGKHIVIGDKVKIDPHFLLAVFPSYVGKDNPVKSNGKGIVIGDGTTFNRYLTIYCADSVRIGKMSCLAEVYWLQIIIMVWMADPVNRIAASL